MTNLNLFINSKNLSLAYLLSKVPNDKDSAPAMIFFSGYRSNLAGTKAFFLAEVAEKNDFLYLRFDYSGHGESDGDFKELTLSDWINDSHELINHVLGTKRPLILIGSSMGAWILTKLLERDDFKNREIKIIFIAPALDFTNRLLTAQRQSPEYKTQLEAKGYVEMPCDYEGENFIITQKFLDDGDRNQTLHQKISFYGQIHIIQGMQDKEVPAQHALLIAEQFETNDITIEIIKSAEHNLNRPEDLEKLERCVKEMNLSFSLINYN